DHESLLRRILDQLPVELNWLSDQYAWAAMQGYLLKGARALIWGRADDGKRHFEKAIKLGARFDEYFLNTLTHKLLDYEAEFGAEAGEDVFQALIPFLEKLGGKSSVRELKSSLSINQAFKNYHAGDRANVPAQILDAIINNPRYLVNRGTLSVLFHSITGNGNKQDQQATKSR
ncbi:MAG: hypothetical protein R3359_11575, partial [Marinirhabdus sp.]|nr:hypothetical protein [Marinirhabdus sp.]